MPERKKRFCKFCGEQVDFLEDFNDYFCQHCHSFQTHAEPIDTPRGKKAFASKVDNTLPPEKQPSLPPFWQQNIPIFRHREYLIVQAILSWGPKYTIYNVSGQKMGEIRGKVLSWGGDFEIFDFNNNLVGRIVGTPQLFGFQDKTFKIYDHTGAFRGAIVGRYAFLKRKWELYDAHKNLIGIPNEQIWFKTNWQMVDSRGNLLLSVDKKLFAFRDQFRIVVSETIDPFIALAYAIAIDWMYFRKSD
ncbi:MAG: hypothetical protein ACTSXO_11445 [Candidatus Heimdallarchaeota archaeon]